MTQVLIFASVHAPGETSAGIRCGKLARAASKAGLEVRYVHPAARDSRYEWRDGVRCVSFAAPIAERIFRRAAGTAGSAPEGSRSRLVAYASRLVRRFARAALQPDEFVLEGPRFARALRAAILDARNDGLSPIIVCCAPPWSTTLAARWAAMRTGAPVILDLQDLWSENPVARWHSLNRRLAASLERGAFNGAAAFVFINERIADRYVARHPVATRRPWTVAHIGSDHPPHGVMHAGPGDSIELLHIGSIYGDRDLRPLLEACATCRSSGRDIRVVWYGRILGDHPLRAELPRYRALGVLELHDPIPHDAARTRMTAADLLVAVPSPVYREELTGKLFDYVDAGRPVLALARPDAFIAEVLRTAGIGTAFDPSDSAAIAEFLMRVLDVGVQYTPAPAVMASFTPEAMGKAILKLAGDLGR